MQRQVIWNMSGTGAFIPTPLGWPVMKDSYMKDLNLFTCLDDIFLSVAGYTLFEEVASENAVAALLHHVASWMCRLSHCETTCVLSVKRLQKAYRHMDWPSGRAARPWHSCSTRDFTIYRLVANWNSFTGVLKKRYGAGYWQLCQTLQRWLHFSLDIEATGCHWYIR